MGGKRLLRDAEFSVVPSGLTRSLQAYPGLPPWANILRPFGAVLVVAERHLLTRGFAFVLQQPALALHAAAVAGEGSVRSDHAMAGNDHADWV